MFPLNSSTSKTLFTREFECVHVHKQSSNIMVKRLEGTNSNRVKMKL